MSPSPMAMGSSDEGVIMTPARRRRLLAESSERLRREAEARDWRDWANLGPDLVDEVSGRLLNLDVAEYLRFRAVCRPWRDLAADPRAVAGPLDPRFRPRSWAVLSITHDARPRRRLLNLATAASIGVDLPALSTHCHVCAADGLLVLVHRDTETIRLLNPLTGAVTDFPTISDIVSQNGKGKVATPYFRGGMKPSMINGAGFDNSTSPPTLVLCLRDYMSMIVVAQPGDANWTVVAPGQAFHPGYVSAAGNCKTLFYSLLSRGGRCYLTSPEGSVYVLELRPLPRLVEIIGQRHVCAPHTRELNGVISFLADDDDGQGGGGRMLMVRYWRWPNVNHFGGRAAHKRKRSTTLFSGGGVTGSMEVVEVDVAGRRLLPVGSLGRRAVFAGLTHCVVVSTETFPSIAGDTVHLGRHHQADIAMFLDEDWCRYPRARPCNLDQYLVCYVDSVEDNRRECINHAWHAVYWLKVE